MFSLVIALATCYRVGISAQDAVNQNSKSRRSSRSAAMPCRRGSTRRTRVAAQCASVVERSTDPLLTLHALIALAYSPWKQAPRVCELAATNLISGGPDWTRSARYAIRHSSRKEPTATHMNAAELRGGPMRQQAAVAARRTVQVGGEARGTRQVPVYLLMVDDSVNVAKSRMARSAEVGHAISDNLRAMNSIFTSYPTGRDGTRYVSISFDNSLWRDSRKAGDGGQRPVSGSCPAARACLISSSNMTTTARRGRRCSRRFAKQWVLDFGRHRPLPLDVLW